ncbi:7-dehydrocholesterol reductase [Cladobotryum mycophilum]|uniref:7-dehydrocholesterol reductase n=1 Tax=Cladobotryum mycophilum TaxID=491253 RepID=A0ABR0T4X2_9HYPO
MGGFPSGSVHFRAWASALRATNPRGRRLPYRLNGTRAWIITIVVGAAASYYGLIDPTFIAKQWGSLLATASLYCATLIAIFQVKARLWPDNAGDTLFTGGFWYDIFNGGELHPRTGLMFDWKHFNASRTGGMLTWTVIDLSFAALQYRQLGTLTSSMVIAVVFRLCIVWEYFHWENWFFETLDGNHERFSFYNIYGFAAMMPHIWTLQTQYLALHPVTLPRSQEIAVVALFISGWALQHLVNRQKSLARETAGECTIWGRKAKCLEATYQTADGKTHRTVLLCSGWWGVMRHGNYAGTILYDWASCLACGTGHIFPYAEAILVTGLVIHRCLRDEARCREKYGKTWDEYCRIVKWRIIPGIY